MPEGLRSAAGELRTFDEMMASSPESPFCLFSYYCDNLGDHIQTLALLQHVRPAVLVHRDHLTPYPDLCLLANGWISNGRLADPAQFREVRYLGVHLAWERRNPRDAETIAQFGEVGCRDPATRDYFKSLGFPAVLTGCATSSLPEYLGPREGVYCVDVPDAVKERAVRLFRDPVFLTHNLEPHFRWRYYPEEIDATVVTAQFRRAHEQLHKYMTAELVITARVHAALPSAALGTPVVYVGVTEEDDDRVGVVTDAGIPCITQGDQLSSHRVGKREASHSALLRERFLQHLYGRVAQIRGPASAATAPAPS